MTDELEDAPEYMDYARRALRAAQLLLDDGDRVGAVNRAYYAIFYSAKPHSMMRVVRRSKWPKEATVQQQAATTELVRRLCSAYPDRILSVVLFGSVARGVSKPESDIDILIIASNADADFEWDVLGIGARVSLECDVIFNLHVYSQDLWKTLQSARRTLWRNVKREGIQLSLRPLAA